MMKKTGDAPLYLFVFEDAAHQCKGGEMDLADIAKECVTLPCEVVGFLTHRSKTKVVLSQTRSDDEEHGWGYRDHIAIPAKNIIRSRKLR
jgi:hypothetical protein